MFSNTFGSTPRGSMPTTSPWIAALRHRPTASFHQPTAVTKNAADVSLIIDAMNLVHTDPPDGFCIVSSDCDFVHLAHYLRALGFAVYGFGCAKSPQELVAAFTSFYVIDQITEAAAIRRIREFLSTPRGANGGPQWKSMAAIYAHMRENDPDFTPKRPRLPHSAPHASTTRWV